MFNQLLLNGIIAGGGIIDCRLRTVDFRQKIKKGDESEFTNQI